MRYPTKEQCFEFYKEQNTPQNMIEHVILVNKIAVFLAKKLKENGEKIDIKLVDAASLLHDLDKWICVNDKSLKHGFESERILTEKGFPEIGYYARQHVAEFITFGYKTWEEKVIAYADKRVNGDKIVSLKERFDYINIRYPAKDKKIRDDTIRLSYELEKEICEKIKIKAEELEKYIK